MSTLPSKDEPIPISTYRLQFNKNFTFNQACDIIHYLDELGVSDCYASPLAKAHEGSLHGYDVVDPSQINPEIGTEKEFASFAKKLRKRGLGLLLDIVPNHMCIADSTNAWWNDVLENGESSQHATFFNIDWNSAKPKLNHKVLLPFLERQYGTVIENQEIALHYDSGAFFINYADKQLPLRPKTWIPILESLVSQLEKDHHETDPFLELQSIITALYHLPDITETDPQEIKERQREKETTKKRLGVLLDQNQKMKEELESIIKTYNGIKGEPDSFNELEGLLKDQAYRLSFWKIANEEINYRRFFDQNQYAGIRVELPEVFAQMHELPFKLIKEGFITGLRVDHVDGLYDPDKYFQDLQKGCSLALGEKPDESPKNKFYVVVEKILTGNEQLRSRWQIYGTTGYEFLNLLNGVFVVQDSKGPIRSIYKDFTGYIWNPFDLMYSCKRFILLVSMSSELQMLSRQLDRISDQHRSSRDFTFDGLRYALSNIIACFPVYRSYIRPDENEVNGEDRQYIERTVRKAKKINPATNASIFDFIKSVLLLENPSDLTEEQLQERKQFVMSFQQLTGPVMAKGMEDTAFYRSYPLASLNEVGSDSFAFGTSIEKFHEENSKRQQEWPHTLLATTTHDTKRSEDVRARINVLSEIPEEWNQALLRWREFNKSKKISLEEDEVEVPDANEEYLLYQTLIGSWPMESLDSKSREVYTKRIEAYMLKAIKEAKLHTSWINPDDKYDQAVQDFVKSVLKEDNTNLFLQDFERFMPKILWAGMFNGLSQLALKIASPGVPDIYQGSELWNLTLVDPDNRHPVDYTSRIAMLDQIKKDAVEPGKLLSSLLKNPNDGRIKLYVAWRGLNFRKENRELFQFGEYIPLKIIGDKKEHALAFARKFDGKTIIVAAARNFASLCQPGKLPVGAKIWAESSISLPQSLQQGQYRDIFTNESLSSNGEIGLDQIFKRLPIAILEWKVN